MTYKAPKDDPKARIEMHHKRIKDITKDLLAVVEKNYVKSGKDHWGVVGSLAHAGDELAEIYASLNNGRPHKAAKYEQEEPMKQNFSSFLQEASNSQMRAWIVKKVEGTSETHDKIKREFVRKFGANKSEYFDKTVSELVD